MKESTAIEFRNVSKTYSIHKDRSMTIRDIFIRGKSPFNTQKIKALDNINFEVNHNEKFGIIGRNGSGKSTIINLIMESIRPDSGGEVLTSGSVMRLEVGTGFDNELNSRQNVMLSSSLLGLSKSNAEGRYNEIIEFAELDEYKELPVKYLSKGMKARLAFATAMNVSPDIMLLDEFFGGGGDIGFKKKSDQLFKERVLVDKTLVIVSHSLNTIEQYCDRAIWLDRGVMKMCGPAKEVTAAYLEHNQ